MENDVINDYECLCFKCQHKINKDKLHIIDIPSLGYGSIFDSCGTTLQLCEDCYNQTPSKWWDLKVCKKYEEFYEYEKDIGEFIDSFLLNSQELVWNTCSKYGYKIPPKDWIDYQLTNNK